MANDTIKYLPTVKRIPDELWDGNKLILPPENPTNTIGRPEVSLGSKIRWYSVRFKNWLSMEDVAKIIWFRFDMS